MNIPELPDSDEVVELRELVDKLRISNEIALNNNKLNRKILNQLVDMELKLTETNEKLTTMDTRLDSIWKRLSGVGNLVWILLLLLGVMWMLVAIYERMGLMRLYLN